MKGSSTLLFNAQLHHVCSMHCYTTGSNDRWQIMTLHRCSAPQFQAAASVHAAATHRGIQAQHQHRKLDGWVGVGPTAVGAAHAGNHHCREVAAACEVSGGEVGVAAGECACPKGAIRVQKGECHSRQELQLHMAFNVRTH